MEETSELNTILNDLLDPWFRSLEKPRESQEETLRTLLKGYENTEYGRKFGASEVKTVSDFQNRFPIANYNALTPYFDQVKIGNYFALFPEPVAKWVMTRGTTGRKSSYEFCAQKERLPVFVRSSAQFEFSVRGLVNQDRAGNGRNRV